MHKLLECFFLSIQSRYDNHPSSSDGVFSVVDKQPHWIHTKKRSVTTVTLQLTTINLPELNNCRHGRASSYRQLECNYNWMEYIGIKISWQGVFKVFRVKVFWSAKTIYDRNKEKLRVCYFVDYATTPLRVPEWRDLKHSATAEQHVVAPLLASHAHIVITLQKWSHHNEIIYITGQSHMISIQFSVWWERLLKNSGLFQ